MISNHIKYIFLDQQLAWWSTNPTPNAIVTYLGQLNELISEPYAFEITGSLVQGQSLYLQVFRTNLVLQLLIIPPAL